MSGLRSVLTLFISLSLIIATGCTKKADDSTSPAKTEGESSAAGEKAPAAAATEPQANPAAKTNDKGPVATVNGKAIARALFDEMFEKMTRVYTKRGQPIPTNVERRHKQNILKRLIEKELLGQKIAEAKIEVSEAELKAGLDKYKEMFRTDANFQRYLKNSSTSLDKIKDNIRFNKALDKLLESSGPIEITEAAAQEYYDKNKRRYQEKESVKASHILLKLDSSADKKTAKAVLKKAKAISKKARKKGADFAALAKEHSEGPTAPKGGNLGYFTRGRMAPEFEEASFKLKVGAVSKPVRTKFGYHVIKAFDHRPEGEKPFTDVKDSISKLLESRERRLRKSKLLRDLRANAKIQELIEIPAPEPPAARAKGGPAGKSRVVTLGGNAQGGKINLKTLTAKPVSPPPGAVVPATAKPATPASPAAAAAPAATP